MFTIHARVSVVAVAAAIALAVPCSAAVFDSIEIAWGQGQIWRSDADTIGQVQQLPDGSYDVKGSYGTSDWNATWDMNLNEDPVVAGNVNITSNVPWADTFTVTISITSVDAFPAPSVLSGRTSMQLVDDVLHGTPDGAQAQALPGDALYTVLLNGAVLATLLDGYALAADPADINATGIQEFGPVDGPAVQVGDTFAIRHRVELSGWDTFQAVSRAEIIMPEPATLGLLALTPVLFRARRRHTR